MASESAFFDDFRIPNNGKSWPESARECCRSQDILFLGKWMEPKGRIVWEIVLGKY